MKEAVDKYDKEVYSRGKAEVELSRGQTDATHDHANYLNPLKSPIVKQGVRPATQAES